MKLTKEEQELILSKRKEKEQEELANTPIKTGILKHDLYCYDSEENQYDWSQSWHYQPISKIKMNQMLENFKVAIHKGTKFYCYNGGEGSLDKEFWFDEEYGMENLNSEWAKENLIKIRKYTKHVKSKA